MTTFVYCGLIVTAVAIIIAISNISGTVNKAKQKCDDLDTEVSDLKDEIFYLKMKIESLQAGIKD